MNKLSFKEYYESKEQLLLASKNVPKILSEYVVKKYCKLPTIGSDNKNYIALKPKDRIKILWEFQNVKSGPVAKYLIIDDQKYLPTWNNDKLQKWVDITTEKVK